MSALPPNRTPTKPRANAPSAAAGVGASTLSNGQVSTQRTTEAKENYRLLKKRFKFLVYENECYQEEIRNLQRKLLKLSRDKK